MSMTLNIPMMAKGIEDKPNSDFTLQLQDAGHVKLLQKLH